MSVGLNANNNVQGLNANRYTTAAAKQRAAIMEKIASGHRINKAADDPAGLAISEMLRAQLSGFSRALSNTQETSNMMGIAEGGLGGISSMLTKMRGLAIGALNTGVRGSMETAADQMEMNSALSTIGRVVSTTSYGGTNLLDGTKGSLTYSTNDPSGMIDTSGTNIASSNHLSDISINFAGGTDAQAEKAHLEADFGGATLSADQQFTVTGTDGARTFSFAAGTSVADMAEQINSVADSTGVNAYAIRDDGTGATSIRLASTEYGADATVKVEQLQGNGFANAGQTALDYGQDATVQINGQSVVSDGLTASYTGTSSGQVAFNAGSPDATTIAQTGYDQDTLADASASRDAALTNVKGGMQLQLTDGSGQQSRQTVSIGDYSPANLGTVEYNGEKYSINDLYGGGAASLENNPELALKIIDQAISDVAAGRANIGAYQANALDTNANYLQGAIENVTRTESAIRDTDMAEMMSNFIATQLLEKSGLRQMQQSNIQAQSVLQLLGMGR